MVLRCLAKITTWLFVVRGIESAAGTSRKSDGEGDEKVLKAACGDLTEEDDDEMEQEEMFVDPDVSLGQTQREWGGPRRGGRLPEPTRYGDWERKARCTDF